MTKTLRKYLLDPEQRAERRERKKKHKEALKQNRHKTRRMLREIIYYGDRKEIIYYGDEEE